MPWYLKVLILTILLLIPTHSLVLWRFGRAARIGLGLPVRPVFFLGVLVLLVLVAAPIVALIAYRLEEAGRWMPASGLWLERVLYGYPLTDVVLIYPFWFGLIATLQLGPLLLVLEPALRLSEPTLRRILPFLGDAEAGRRFRARIVLVFFCLGGLYIGARLYLDTNTVRQMRSEIPIANLPEALEGLRIVHISDIQADYYTGTAKLERYARAVNQLKPDLVVFTGDLITRDPKQVAPGARLLEQLRAPHGVFAAMGDHDVWYAPELIRRSLREAGVVLRENQNVNIRVNGERIGLTILTTVYRQQPSSARLRRLARETRDKGLRLMMGHQSPDEVVAFARKAGYALYLGGHTHGGQLSFSFFGWSFSAVGLRETRFVSGLYYEGEMPVHVNNGLGMTFAPIRFQAPAGVSLLVLKRKG